jgi:sulfhydrogenase subunit gamma (sulfur reductase)
MAVATQPMPAASDLYVPRPVRVLEVREEIAPDPAAGTRRMVTLSLERGDLDYLPGQFLQVTAFGGGEVPISISSPGGMPGALYLTIRDNGVVSGMLVAAKAGDVVGVRGPFGNHFDLDAHRGRDLFFVGGGCGLAPLRGLYWEALLRRSDFGRIVLLHGSRCPGEMLYGWQWPDYERQGVEIHLSADRADDCWAREEHPPRCVGLITKLFDQAHIVPERASAFLCGPPIMIENGGRELVERIGIAPDRVLGTLERHMKCGVGKCGHCVVVDRYVCIDGPVFSYEELAALGRIEPAW